MTEHIGVTYVKVAGTLFGYHMALFYEKSDGTRTVLEATSQNIENMTAEQAQQGLFLDLFNGKQSDFESPFGKIIVKPERPWNTTDPFIADDKKPFNILAEGADLSSKWATVLAEGNRIESEGYWYRPVYQNSNSFVVTLAKLAGIEVPSGVAIDPLTHGVVTLPTPGSQNELFDPILPDVTAAPSGFTLSSFGEANGSVTEIADWPSAPADGIKQVALHLSSDNLIDQVSILNGEGQRITTLYDILDQELWLKKVSLSSSNGQSIAGVEIDDNHQVVSATHNGVEFAGNIGAFFGSKLGQTLGGNSLAGKLAAGTILGAVGAEIGKALTMGASYSLDLAVKNVFGTLAGGTNVGSLASGGIATVSSLLMSEAAEAVGLHGFAGGLFTTVSTTITTKLITNAFGVMTGATVPVEGGGSVPVTLFSGFDTAAFAGQLGGAVGGYLGSTLAAQVMTPHYAEGATGESIGSSIGGMIGAFALAEIPVVGPIVGSFVGSFLGGVAGSLLGDLAGNDPESQGTLLLGADHHFWPDPRSFWGDHGANGNTFMNIAGPGDGILVIDLGANGPDNVINQVNEFAFSKWTDNPNDTDVEALKTQFDTNHNGKLDPGDDPWWGQFRVWSDVNQTGMRDGGQLQTLAALGITEISLTTDHQAFGLPDGSVINGLGSFTRNGVTGSFADASLAYDTTGFKRLPSVVAHLCDASPEYAGADAVMS